MISAICFICNGTKQWIIMDGDVFWTIKKLSDAIGKSSAANRLNSVLKINELNEVNLYEWLESHVPLCESTVLNND